jgi:hypothetical protein
MNFLRIQEITHVIITKENFTYILPYSGQLLKEEGKKYVVRSLIDFNIHHMSVIKAKRMP